VNLSPRALLHAFRVDVKLRQKLLISYLAIIVIPFVILAIFVSQKVSRIVEERIAYSADQAFQQAGAFLEYRLYNVLKVSHVFLVDPQINAILLKSMDGYDLRSQRMDMDTLTSLFFGYQDGVNIDRIRLYVRDGLEYAEERVNLFGMAHARGSRWFSSLEASGSTYLWCPAEYLEADGEESRNSLSLARYIMDLNDLRRRIGVLRIDIKKSQVVDILAKSSSITDSITYVQNQEGDIVASSNPALLARFKPYVSQISDSFPAEGGLHRLRAGGGEALVEQRSLETSDWRIITILPFSGIEAQSRAIRDQIFLVIFAIATAAYILAYWVSRSITRRLSHIMAKMGSAKGGTLEKLSLPIGSDEIGELARTYDMMIDEIETLIAREERTQRELKGAELKALQAQINPHFLYNTLDMIKWMSRRGMADEIEELLNSMATFYRLSLSQGRETIPIRDELRHVELYARIQNMRFRGAIDFAIAVDSAVLDLGILRVTLQPLVENSILHGINEKPDKRGRIAISGGFRNGGVELVVTDDGVGMDPQQLSTLLDSEGSRRNGFGVRNIHERYRLYYGESYGLSYLSEPGRGTTVTVRFTAQNAVVQESRQV
jgi:two-component system sensor histidine kinase YesM